LRPLGDLKEATSEDIVTDFIKIHENVNRRDLKLMGIPHKEYPIRQDSIFSPEPSRLSVVKT